MVRLGILHNRSLRYYDTHCHLHDATAFPDPIPFLDRARAAGVERLNVIGVNPADWDVALTFTERHEDVFAVLGWHPNYTADYDPSSLIRLAELLRHPKVVGIGEMGLDRHWAYSEIDKQLTAMRDQLELARDFDLPIVFQVRDAFPDFIPPPEFPEFVWWGVRPFLAQLTEKIVARRSFDRRSLGESSFATVN